MSLTAEKSERVDLEALLREGQQPVTRYLLARIGSAAEAAELAQETLVRAYCALSQGDRPRHPIPWLLAIARHVFLEALRERRYERRLCERLACLTDREWQVPWHEQLERRLVVGSAVDDLPAELREPVLLHYFAGFSLPEVARHLEITAGAVRTRLWRARRSLRGGLEVLMDDARRTGAHSSAADAGLRNAGVLIEWLGNPCQCRCRHCLLCHSGRVARVAFERVKAVVDRFVAWRDREMPADFVVQLISGYSDELPHFVEWFEFCRQRGLPLPASFSVNGIALRTDQEILEILQIIRQLGVKGITTSFFGMSETHDRFAGRRGDYDFLMRFARLAADRGFGRAEAIYLTKRNLAEIPELVRLLDRIPGMTCRQIKPSQYRGRAKRLERERVTATATAALPDCVRRQINAGTARPIHSEAEWMAKIRAGDIPKQTERYALLPVTEGNVEDLQKADCAALLRAIWEADDASRRSLPSLPELARLFGKPSGKRLYILRDLDWKWGDAYLDQHPELDRSGTFDDTRVSVLAH